MRLPLIFAAATSLSFVSILGPQARVAGASPAHRVPVLVELFTSEGCSDCPPADALLARLDATQFVPGAQAIVLSEHVTYWNHQGWSDPFSLQTLDDRQQRYAWHFSVPQVYTPQIVVDGRWQFVGSDAASLSRDLASAASTPKLTIEIADAQLSKREVLFSVHGAEGSRANLIAALADDSATSNVKRGENAGRTLRNVAIVRALKDFGSKSEGRPLSLPLPVPDRAAPTQGPFRLIVFLSRHSDGQVIAIAEQTLGQ